MGKDGRFWLQCQSIGDAHARFGSFSAGPLEFYPRSYRFFTGGRFRKRRSPITLFTGDRSKKASSTLRFGADQIQYRSVFEPWKRLKPLHIANLATFPNQISPIDFTDETEKQASATSEDREPRHRTLAIFEHKEFSNEVREKVRDKV
jgi:hypothetical protein